LFFPWIVLIFSHTHIRIINIDVLFCQRFKAFIYNIILIDNITCLAYTILSIDSSSRGGEVAVVPAEVGFAMKENRGKDMKFFNVEMLKDLSAEDMERLRREIKNLNRRVREELDRRERYCAHCGDRLGTSVYGLRYCSAWHSYLSSRENTTTVSRVEFERKRAVRRIRTIRKAAQAGATMSENSKLEGAAALKASFRNQRIGRILNEYQTITGESFNQSMRDYRRSRATEQ